MKKIYPLLFSLFFLLAIFKTYANFQAPITASVSPIIEANAGVDKTICNGTSTQLEGNASGGSGTIYYLWTPSAGLSSNTVAKPIASPTSTTIYTLEVSDGITSSQDALEVVVEDSPIITINASPNMICEGQYSLVSAFCINTSENTYLWNTGQTTNNINVNPAINTSYTVTITGKNGCSNSAAATVVVNSLPVVGIDNYASVGDCSPSFTLTGNPGGGNFSGAGVVGTTFSPSMAGVGTHSVTYTYTDFIGTSCSNSATTYITVTSCSGIAEELLLNSFSVFPNPTNKLLTIKFNADGPFTLKLMSANGQVIEQEQQNYKGEYRKVYNTNNNAKGIYYLQIISNEENVTKKIVFE